MLTIRQELAVDFDETAALACEGFGVPAGGFTAARMRWLYERAFSHGTVVFSAYAQERKVGQVALVRQSVELMGVSEPAVALMDLFILKGFRSRDAIASLYGAVEAFCREHAIRFILAVPNEKAAGVNVRFLKLAPLGPLDIRAGFAWLGQRVRSRRVADLDPAEARALLARHGPAPGTGLLWTPEGLWARLQKPDAGYALHEGENALLVSAARRSGRVRHALLCAILPRSGATLTGRDTAFLAAAACRLHGTPLFVYVGLNRDVPLPGWSLPKRLRPSQMILQLRDFRPDAGPVAFDRFEILDFDFA